MFASILARPGRIPKGLSLCDQGEQLSPGFIRQHAEWQPYSDPEANAHFHDAMRLMEP